MTFIPLTTGEQWEQIKEQSNLRPVVIFKHSNRCGGSADAEHKLRIAGEQGEFPPDIHQLVVQHSRELSNQIAAELNVLHQSPQVIVMHNEQSIYDVSHRAIDPSRLLAVIRAAKGKSG